MWRGDQTESLRPEFPNLSGFVARGLMKWRGEESGWLHRSGGQACACTHSSVCASGRHARLLLVHKWGCGCVLVCHFRAPVLNGSGVREPCLRPGGSNIGNFKPCRLQLPKFRSQRGYCATHAVILLSSTACETLF